MGIGLLLYKLVIDKDNKNYKEVDLSYENNIIFNNLDISKDFIGNAFLCPCATIAGPEGSYDSYFRPLDWDYPKQWIKNNITDKDYQDMYMSWLDMMEKDQTLWLSI